MVFSIAGNVGLFIIVLRKATTVNKTKISMIVSLSVLSILSWVPGAIYGTVLKSSGYPVYLRFTNYVISVDTTFSTLLFIYFYPSFRSFILGLLTCGKMGAISRIESDRKRSRAISAKVYAPLQSRVSKKISTQSIEFSLDSPVQRISRLKLRDNSQISVVAENQ